MATRTLKPPRWQDQTPWRGFDDGSLAEGVGTKVLAAEDAVAIAAFRDGAGAALLSDEPQRVQPVAPAAEAYAGIAPGVPAGATAIERFVVLRGRRPDLTGVTFQRTADGDKHPPGHDLAVRGTWQAQRDDRVMHIYQLGDLWHVLLVDGHQQWLLLASEQGGFPDREMARRVAGALWRQVRPLAELHPDRWERP